MMTHFIRPQNTLHLIWPQKIFVKLRFSLWATTFFGVFWTVLSMIGPNLYIRIFMSLTPEILNIAPAIIRTYALSFLLLPMFLLAASLWFAMPVTEFLVMVYAAITIKTIQKHCRIAAPNILLDKSTFLQQNFNIRSFDFFQNDPQ